MINSAGSAAEPKKNKWRKRIFISFSIIIILFIAFVFICGIPYSKGARTGVVIKGSEKGFLFKTYEGELNLGGISEGDGTIMPNRIWKFSIQRNDTEVYNTLIHTQGKHVRLYYTEVLKSFFWQADTPYIVTKVEVVN